MKRVDDSARERNIKNADAAPCRGEFEATREAWIRWITKGCLEDGFKFFGTRLLSLYASRKVHNAERALVAWPKPETLAAEHGLSVSQAYRRIERLVEQGYLSRWTGPLPRDEYARGRGRPSAAYRFTMPPAENFSHTWCEKLTRIFSHPGCEELGGIFSHLRSEFFASGAELFASPSEEVPVESGFAPGLFERLSDKRLTDKDIAALRAATGETRLRAQGTWNWDEIIATTSTGGVIARAPTFDEYIEFSDGKELLEFFRDYVDDNGHPIEFAAAPNDDGHNSDSFAASRRVESKKKNGRKADESKNGSKLESQPENGRFPLCATPSPPRAPFDVVAEREAREKREQEFRAKMGLSAEEPLF